MDSRRYQRIHIFVHAAKKDTWSATSDKCKIDAKNSGYTFMRDEPVLVLTRPELGTVPLNLYYHSWRQDSLLSAHPEGQKEALASGYNLVRTVGYAFPTPRIHDSMPSRPLLMYYNAQCKDTITVAAPPPSSNNKDDDHDHDHDDQHQKYRNQGYRFVREDCYVPDAAFYVEKKPYRTWMGDLGEKIAQISLCELSIPGTHDSGTYSLNVMNDLAPATPDFVKALQKIPFLGNAIKYKIFDWSITQYLTIFEQLEEGVRYFDLRVAARSDGNMYIVHGMFGDTIESVINDVALFLNASNNNNNNDDDDDNNNNNRIRTRTRTRNRTRNNNNNDNDNDNDNENYMSKVEEGAALVVIEKYFSNDNNNNNTSTSTSTTSTTTNNNGSGSGSGSGNDNDNGNGGTDKEVIILDFNHFYNMDGALHRRLVEKLVSALGRHRFARCGADGLRPTSTMREFWERGAQVIVLYDDALMQREYPDLLWNPHATLSSPWANTSSLDALRTFMSDSLQRRPTDALHVLQGVLTPDASMIQASIFGGCSEATTTLETMAAMHVNPMVMRLLETLPLRENIVMVDFIHRSNLVEMLMARNREKARNWEAAQQQQQQQQQRQSTGGLSGMMSDELQLALAADAEVDDKRFPHRRWMGNFGDRIQNIPLNELSIPGAHNSGSFSVNPHNDVAPASPDFTKVLSKIPMLGGTVKNKIFDWCLTQRRTILEQLEDGIRYLDLRVSAKTQDGTGDGADLYYVHGFYGDLIFSFIDQVQRFLRIGGEKQNGGAGNNPFEREIVVLDFNHFYQMTPQLHEKLITKLISAFGSKIARRSTTTADGGDGGLLPTSTLRDFWDRGAQVVILYDDEESVQRHPDILWPQTAIRSPWPRTTELEYLKMHTTEQLERRPTDAFFVSQLILTPDTAMILADGILSASTLESAALQVNASALRHLESLPLRENVILCDHYDRSPLVSVAMARNELKIQERNKK